MIKRAWAVVFAAIAGSVIFVDAVKSDEIEKTPRRDNAVLKSILSPDMKITGRWIGVIRRGFEEHTLTVDTDPDDKEAYRLKFYSWTDTSGVVTTKRKAKLVNGIISFDEPIKGFGISKAPFSVLYAVRADGKDFLVPGANADELKTVEDVTRRIAYQFQRRTTR